MRNQENLSEQQAQDTNEQYLQGTPSQEDFSVLDEGQLEEVAGAGACCGKLKRTKSAPVILVVHPGGEIQMAIPTPLGQTKPGPSNAQTEPGPSNVQNVLQRQRSLPGLSSSSSSSPERLDPWTPHPGR